MQPDNRTRHQRLEKQVGKAASPSDRPIKIPLEDFDWIHVSCYTLHGLFLGIFVCLFVCLFFEVINIIQMHCNSINFLMAMQRLSDFIYCQIKVLPPVPRYQLRSSWHKECLFFKGSNIQIAVPAVLVLQYPVCHPGVTWFLSPPLSPSTFGVGMLSPSSTLNHSQCISLHVMLYTIRPYLGHSQKK